MHWPTMLMRLNKPDDMRASLSGDLVGVGGSSRGNRKMPINFSHAKTTTTITCTTSIHVVTLLILLGCCGVSCQESEATVVQQTQGVAEMLGCHERWYIYHISKPYTMPDGRVLSCEDDIAVKSCWGRCDTSQIGDYINPFKISRHKVCTYTGRRVHKYRLRNCPEEHPDPETEIFDAEGCACRLCLSGSDTSCESLNGS